MPALPAPDRFRLPSLRHLRVFETVARCENLSRAAGEANMSQPAVTLAVMKIEDWAGTKLFLRNRTGTFLTDEGRILLDGIRRLFARIEAALETGLLREASCAARRMAISRLKAAHINVLAAIAGSSSFEDAALALGLSRTAVQRTARELEVTLGRDLYTRAPHGLIANEAARDLSMRLQRACQELREGIDEMGLLSGRAAARIFIGAQPLASISLLAAAINGVLALHPEAQVRIIEGSYQYLLQELRSGRLDVMFGALKRPGGMTDVVEEALFEEPYCVVARYGHPLARQDRVSIADLAHVDWVLPGAGTQRRSAFERLFENEAHRPTSCIDATSVFAQIALLSSSDRVTLLTPIELALEPQLSGLVALLPIDTCIGRSADGLTMRAGWKPTPFQASFLDHLRERVRELGLSRGVPVAARRGMLPKRLLDVGVPPPTPTLPTRGRERTAPAPIPSP